MCLMKPFIFLDGKEQLQLRRQSKAGIVNNGHSSKEINELHSAFFNINMAIFLLFKGRQMYFEC